MTPYLDALARELAAQGQFIGEREPVYVRALALLVSALASAVGAALG
jgi:hypothetical protein